METIQSHYLSRRSDGTATLYDISYVVTRHREGVLRYVKVHCSERPCACAARETHAQRRSEAPE